MDQETWHCPSHGNGCCWPRSCHPSRRYDRFVPVRRSPKAPTWMQLWRKFKKEKKRLFRCSISESLSMGFTYDPLSYSKNFDQGTLCDDPDDLCRSFSARFAVPSSIFDKNTLVL